VLKPPKPPSIAPGVTSFIWAALLGLYIWAGLLAVGVSSATAVIMAAVSFCAIFLYVRTYGQERPRRPWPRRS
jgi:hypothetical protein